MHSSTTPLRRFTLASVTALALGAALVGCGSDDKSAPKADSTPTETAPAVKVLTDPEAATVLLTERNLGDKFTLDTEESDSPSPGCLTAFDDVLGDESPAKAQAENSYFSTASEGYPLVGSKVLSYESDEAAEEAIEKLGEALEDCTTVSEPLSGATLALEVQTNNEKSASGADDQLNLQATGTYGQGEAVLVASVIRIDNNLVAISGQTVDVDFPGPITDVIDVLVDRLKAVAGGDLPDETAVAGA